MNNLTCQLELSSKCNLCCDYCYKSNPLYKVYTDTLNDDDWVEIAADINPSIFSTVVISGGEPFLSFQRLTKVVESLGTDIKNIIILTNGILAEKDKITSLLKIRKDLIFQISLDGITNKTHNKYRKSKQSDWEKVINTCVNLNMQKARYDISTVISKDNINDLENILKVSYVLGASQIHFCEKLNWDKKFGLYEPFLTETERSFVKKEFVELRKNWKQIIDLTLAPSYGEYLKILKSKRWGGIVVRENGSYNVDCLLPVNISHKFPEQSISEALELVQSPDFSSNIENYLKIAEQHFYGINHLDQDQSFNNKSSLEDIVSHLKGGLLSNYLFELNKKKFLTIDDNMFNEQMIEIINSLIHGNDVIETANRIANTWNIDSNNAMLDTLIALQQLIESGLGRWRFCNDRQ